MAERPCDGNKLKRAGNLQELCMIDLQIPPIIASAAVSLKCEVQPTYMQSVVRLLSTNSDTLVLVVCIVHTRKNLSKIISLKLYFLSPTIVAQDESLYSSYYANKKLSSPSGFLCCERRGLEKWEFELKNWPQFRSIILRAGSKLQDITKDLKKMI